MIKNSHEINKILRILFMGFLVLNFNIVNNFAAEQQNSPNVTISQIITSPVTQTIAPQPQIDSNISGMDTTSTSTTTVNQTNNQSSTKPDDKAKTTQDFEISSIVGGEFLKIKDSNEIKDSAEDANIYLNFDNVSLVNVVNYLAEQKKINVIPHRDLANATVTLTTRTALTKERAWNILLTLLEMNGFSMVQVGNLYRVVSNKENKFEPLPIVSMDPKNLPENETVVRFVYFFKNIKVDMVRDILGSMLDREGIIISTDLNACIIKETSIKIKRAMDILTELDQGGLSEQVKMIQLKHADALVLEKLFQDILQSAAQASASISFGSSSGKKERSFFSTTTRIIAEPRKNSLFMLGTQKSLDRITDFIYKYLDVPIGEADSRLHIKQINYAKAEDLKPILDDVIKPPTGQASDKSVLVGEYKFFEDVTIVAEKISTDQSTSTRGGGNRLIVACTKEDWKRIEKLIEKLDKPQPQVAFEIMIVTVQIDETKQLGSQTFGLLGRQPGMGINNTEFINLNPGISKNNITTPDNSHYIKLATAEFEGGDHPSFLTLGRPGTPGNPGSENIWSIIKTVFNVDNSHIIAQPFLVTNNNQPCCEEITKTQRIEAGLTSGKGEPSKLQWQDFQAKTRIELLPRMNLDGVVDLDIQIEISEFANVDPTEAKKSNQFLKTRTSMLSGEVLVLGGLTKRKGTEDEAKTPLLGDIPIIGSLFFKNKSKERTDSNLYIFIRPSIIKPKFDGSFDEYTQLKLDYAQYQLLKNDTYLKERDPIQRWFFKPADQSIKQKFLDGKRGIIRPLDNFVSSKFTPHMVNIKEDSYFKVSEELEKQKRLKLRSKSSTKDIVTTSPPIQA